MSRRGRSIKRLVVLVCAGLAAASVYLIARENRIEADFNAYLTAQQCRYARDLLVDCRTERCDKHERGRPYGEVTQKIYFCHANGERMTFRRFMEEQ